MADETRPVRRNLCLLNHPSSLMGGHSAYRTALMHEFGPEELVRSDCVGADTSLRRLGWVSDALPGWSCLCNTTTESRLWESLESRQRSRQGWGGGGGGEYSVEDCCKKSSKGWTGNAVWKIAQQISQHLRLSFTQSQCFRQDSPTARWSAKQKAK